MTEIESFESFRATVALPSLEVRDGARAQLVAALRSRAAVRRRAPRRPGVVLATGVAIVAGVFTVTSLLEGGPGVVERAAAAIDPQGRILHVVVRIEAADGTVTRGESWVRPDGSGRSVDAESGPGGCVSSETELRCLDTVRNVVDVYRYHPGAVEARRKYAELPGFRVDQPQSIHRAFGEGYARLVGETAIGGRAVYEIVLAIPFVDEEGTATPRFDEATSPVLYLDRESYHPVAQRFPDAGSTTFYDAYEFLADELATWRLLGLPTNTETRVVVHPVGEGPQS